MSDAAWHEWRSGGVGGSDIAALIGLSRYASPTSLYYEKTGQLEDRGEDTARQRIGKRMESVLALEFHDRTGLYCVGAQTWCEHPLYKWARCTTDGYSVEAPHRAGVEESPLGTIQMKTDGRFGWPDGIPDNIRAQCIWEMGVTGLPHCWLVVMFAGFRVEVFEIDWDVDAVADWEFMLDKARSFWFDHIMLGTPPPVDDHEATTEALTQVYRDPAGMIDADADALALVYRVRDAMASTAAAEAAEKRWKNELRALLADKTDLIEGWKPAKKNADPTPNVIASWREQASRRVDLDELRRLDPVLVDKATTTTTTRVLRVTKPKGET